MKTQAKLLKQLNKHDMIIVHLMSGNVCISVVLSLSEAPGLAILSLGFPE